MNVEFLGTPGAGKTTLVPVVADFFNAHGYHAYTVVDAARPFAARTIWGRTVTRAAPPRWRPALLWQLFYQLSKLHRLQFVRRHPRLVAQVVAHQRRRPISAADRRHVLYWFYHHLGTYTFLNAQARSGDVLLFDEGFVHRVVQHFASEHEPPDLARVGAYIDLLPRPDLVVVPVAALTVCERRVHARGLWPRFQNKRPADVSQYMAHAHTIVQATVRQIKRRGWTVIEVDNDAVTPAVAAAELRRKLSRLPVPSSMAVGFVQGQFVL